MSLSLSHGRVHHTNAKKWGIHDEIDFLANWDVHKNDESHLWCITWDICCYWSLQRITWIWSYRCSFFNQLSDRRYRELKTQAVIKTLQKFTDFVYFVEKWNCCNILNLYYIKKSFLLIKLKNSKNESNGINCCGCGFCRNFTRWLFDLNQIFAFLTSIVMKIFFCILFSLSVGWNIKV